MALRHEKMKPVTRYTVVDDGITKWAVYDRKTKELVRTDLSDPLQARLIAEELEENQED